MSRRDVEEHPMRVNSSHGDGQDATEPTSSRGGQGATGSAGDNPRTHAAEVLEDTLAASHAEESPLGQTAREVACDEVRREGALAGDHSSEPHSIAKASAAAGKEGL